MKEFLPLYPFFFKEQRNLTGLWKTFFASKEDGISEKFYSYDFDDSQWEDTEVPKLFKASNENYSMWYRVFFEPVSLNPDERLLLRFDGVFQSVDVWVNGTYIGGHYGYFSPFSFDITSHVFGDRPNVITLYVESRPDDDLTDKRQIMGIFNDWNFKPYPSLEKGKLHKYVWQVPMGIWAPVYLLKTSDVVPQWIHIKTKEITDEYAILDIDVNLLNLNKSADKQTKVDINIRQGNNSILSIIKSSLIPKGSSYVVVSEVKIEKPLLWWPWSLGEPVLHTMDMNIYIGDILSGHTSEEFGIRKVGYEISSKGDSWILRVNDKKIFIKGISYLSNFFLDKVEKDLFENDLLILKNAYINLIRTYGHVEPREFYHIADRYGLLVMNDFPLVYSYASKASSDDLKEFKNNVRALITESIHMLYNHPSIVFWTVHTSPPWIERVEEYNGLTSELQKLQLNKDIDIEAAETVRQIDSERYVIIGSGDLDSHLYNGWYYGNIDDFMKIDAGFVSEFGFSSLPNYDSKFWRYVVTSPWPISESDESWRNLGYQPVLWKSRIGVPADFPSLESYIKESQDRQAFYIEYVVSHLRKLKFKNCGGIIYFMAIDGYPSISPAIIDYYRNRKHGYYVLRDAYSPLKVLLLPDGKYSIKSGKFITYQKDSKPKVKIYLVNDDPSLSGIDAILTVSAKHGGENFFKKSYSFQVPMAEAPALEIDTITVKPNEIKNHLIEVIAIIMHEEQVLSRTTLKLYVKNSENANK